MAAGSTTGGGEAVEQRVRVPFCLAYDLDALGIRAMRLCTSSAALAPLVRPAP